MQIIDKGGLKYRGWAMHSECFRCGYCNKLLANEHFAPRDDKQFCSDCYGQLFAKRCTRCQKPITGTETSPYSYSVLIIHRTVRLTVLGTV